MPDPARLYQPRINCHNAYDLLIEDMDKGRSLSDADIGWAQTHENARKANAPCPAVPDDLGARARDRVIATPDGLATARAFVAGQQDPAAMFEVGFSIYNGFFSDLAQPEGLALIKQAADKGDPNGMYAYGVLLTQGAMGAKDYKAGIPMLERAGAAGHIDAQFRAAIFHYEGIGTKKDRKKAFPMFRSAAENGHLYATIMAFTMISDGDGTKKDFDLAYRLSRNVAQQGEVYGAVMAASSLLQSKDPMKHETEVLYWMDQAISRGDDKIKAQMQPLRAQVVGIFSRQSAPAEYRPRAFKACPMKTTCTVNHYSGLRSCTTNKDYWSDCDG